MFRQTGLLGPKLPFDSWLNMTFNATIHGYSLHKRKEDLGRGTSYIPIGRDI